MQHIPTVESVIQSDYKLLFQIIRVAVVFLLCGLIQEHFAYSVETNDDDDDEDVDFKDHLVSISPTVYVQLLHAKIPKAQIQQSTQAAFCAFGICRRKSCT